MWKKMCDTYRKSCLEYRGPYHLRIIKKAMIAPDIDYSALPFLYVETEDRKYQGVLEVNLITYRKGKVGQYYKGGVIYNKRKKCYYMSQYEDSRIAIRKAVNSARLRFLFLGIVILLFVSGLLGLVRPLFH